MNRRISYLLLTPLMLIASLILVAWLGVEHFMTRFAYQQATETVRIKARVAADMVKDLGANVDAPAFDVLADRLGGLSGLRITYIDADGQVLGDSRLPAPEIAQLDNHANRPEIRDALEHGEGISRRFSTTLGADLLYVGVPYEYGEQRGVARVARPLLDIQSNVGLARGLTLALAAATIVIASWLVYAATQNVLSEFKREHDELEKAISERIARLTRLQQAGSLLTTCETADEVSQLVRGTAEMLVPGSGGALALFKSSRNQLNQLLAWGEKVHGETIYRPSACWALRRGMEHFTTPDNSSTRCAHLNDIGNSTVLCLPLQAHGEILGVMQIVTPSLEQLSGEPLQLIKTMSEHAAVALSNIQLNEILREQAIRDPLTGLYNRRYLSEALESEIARTIRRKDSLVVLMIDIDHFKNFNDHFGHEAGDVVLGTVGHLIGDSTRGEDIACRYGGEEFVLVLVGSDEVRAREVGQRLCHQVNHLLLSFRGQTLNKISVSVGAAILAHDLESSSALLQRADEMLYRAKQSGRNQVVVAEQTHEDPARGTTPRPSTTTI